MSGKRIVLSHQVYFVEAIRAHRLNFSTRQFQFLVKWQDYPESDNSWEPFVSFVTHPTKHTKVVNATLLDYLKSNALDVEHVQNPLSATQLLSMIASCPTSILYCPDAKSKRSLAWFQREASSSRHLKQPTENAKRKAKEALVQPPRQCKRRRSVSTVHSDHKTAGEEPAGRATLMEAGIPVAGAETDSQATDIDELSLDPFLRLRQEKLSSDYARHRRKYEPEHAHYSRMPAYIMFTPVPATLHDDKGRWKRSPTDVDAEVPSLGPACVAQLRGLVVAEEVPQSAHTGLPGLRDHEVEYVEWDFTAEECDAIMQHIQRLDERRLQE